MRTKLVYSVTKKSEWNDLKNQKVTTIESKGFDFIVTRAKTEEEHKNAVENFYYFMKNNGFIWDAFGTGTWESNGPDSYYLMIAIDNMDKKEEINELYKQWKNRMQYH